MLLVNLLENRREDLEQTIIRHIQERTGGRLRQLHFEENGNRLVIHGCTPSYYVKQLALTAILEVLGPMNPEEVALDIQVGPPGLRLAATEGTDRGTCRPLPNGARRGATP